MFLSPLIYTVIGYILTKLSIPMIFYLLYEGKSIRKNYRGDNIPICSGLVFIPTLTVCTIFAVISLPQNAYVYPLLFLLGTLGIGLAGLVDDLLGNRNTTGLKGHIRALLKGQLTTGGFKAVFGGFIAVITSLILSNNLIDILLNTLIISLFTNFINLLDLRPGRAIKGFLFCGFLLILNPVLQIFQLLLYGLFGSVLAYLPYDLKAKSMLGDVGSNILGISLGIICISADFYIRITALVMLILIHIYTEKYSLTETIEKNKFLKYIDQIGR